MAKFEVFKDKAGKWRFRLKANNHKIVAASEAYESKGNAIKGTIAILTIFRQCFDEPYLVGPPTSILD